MNEDTRPKPLLISSKNAEAVVGQNWRWVKETALAHGLPVYQLGAKRFVDADAFLALARAHRLGPAPAPLPAPLPPEEPLTDAQEQERIARLLGLARARPAARIELAAEPKRRR